MKTPVLGAAVAVALAGSGVLWAGVAAQQETRSTPGPGSGMMTVQGTVDVGTLPEIAVAQRGAWQVAVSDAPPVVLAAPGFARAGARYVITWTGGEQETVTIADPGEGVWVRVQHPAGARWVNLAAARAVEEAK